MSDLVPTHASGVTPAFTSPGLNRQLARIGRNTLIRVANVRAEADISADKIRELNGVAREAVTDYVMLSERTRVMTANDPVLADSVRIFTETARLGAAEVLADLVDTYWRESRR
jgi:hypothetical protein